MSIKMLVSTFLPAVRQSLQAVACMTILTSRPARSDTNINTQCSSEMSAWVDVKEPAGRVSPLCLTIQNVCGPYMILQSTFFLPTGLLLVCVLTLPLPAGVAKGPAKAQSLGWLGRCSA